MYKIFCSKFFNYYFLISFVFVINYLVNNLFSSYWDTLEFIYLLSLKPSLGHLLYKDYSFPHGPFLIIFFEFLNYFNRDNFNILLCLGIFQSLFAGYLSYLFCSKIIKSSFAKKICFTITIFSFSIEYNFLYWDAYVFLIGIYSLYLIFLQKNFLIGNLLLALVFFLKQTFGLTFFLIYIFIILYDVVSKKKFSLLKNLLYFLIFTFLNLLIIFVFYDIKKFYYENILFLLNYAEEHNRNSLLNYFHGIFFLLPNVSSFDDFKLIFTRTSFSYSQLVFYIIFRLPTFLIIFYLLYKIKDFGKDYYKILLIIILSTILPQPLLGRSYWGTIYYFPIIPIIFITYIFEKKNYLITYYDIKLKKIILTYFCLAFLFLALKTLQKVNYIEFSDEFIIKSKKHFFLNIHRKQLGNDHFNYAKDMYKFMYNLEIKSGVFVLDSFSMSILFLLAQPFVNQDFWSELSESDYQWKARGLRYPADNQNFLERFITDIKVKKPEFILYKIDQFKYLKVILPYNFFKDYYVRYKNKSFVLLQKLNN